MSTTEASHELTVSPARKRAQLSHLAPYVDQIKEADQKVKLYIQHSLKHALKAGQLLCGVKKKIGHGGWLEWFGSAEFDFSERTAQRYMSIYQRWKELQTRIGQGANPTALTDLTFTDALELLSKTDKKPAGRGLPNVRADGVSAGESTEPPKVELDTQSVDAAKLENRSEPSSVQVVYEPIDRTPPAIMSCVERVLTGNTDGTDAGNQFLIVDSGAWPESTALRRVFLQLPFDAEFAESHSSRLLASYQDGRVAEAILLTAACTGARWFRQFRGFLRAFIAAEATKGFSDLPEHGVAIYLGPSNDKFVEAFQSLADVYAPCVSPFSDQKLEPAEQKRRPQ